MSSYEQLPTPLISFDASSVNIAAVGGKGANLVNLVNAGFKVPPGFLLPTEAYEEFVSQNNLSSQIESIIRGTDLSSPEALEEASKQIRLAFSKGVFSEKLRRSLLAGWKWLGDGPVAVRSSATAEDLPDMSFAGQQDTFLNVIGEKDLLVAVVNCWSSLWTARAIGYRTRNKIPHSDVSLSVVVQQMIQSYSSGVLFTANPLTGLRKEVVIDATIGLGEALVSGQVEPDHYVINSDSWVITTISLGKKSLVIHGQSEGGVQFKNADSSQIQALPKDVIIELSKIGKEIEALYGFPQDIEWAWAEGNLYILQSRPITSLFPIPEVLDSDHLQVFFSFGAVQGLLDPMTPLGQDAIRMIFAGASRLFGYYDLNQHTQRIFEIAGERLWANFTPIIRNPIGSKMILKLFPGIEPGSIDALKEILSDPKIGAGSGRIRLKSLIRMTKFAVPMLGRMLYFAHKPERKAQMIKNRYEAQLQTLEENHNYPSKNQLNLEENIALFREISGAFNYVIPNIVPGALPGLLPLLFLSKLSKQYHGSNDLALQITRGLPNNVTTEMDLKLWQSAKTIKADRVSYEQLISNPAEEITQAFLANELAHTAQVEIGKFLTAYGMRGLGEIDIGRPRWRENPAQIIMTLQSYLQIEDKSSAPDAVFQRGADQAQDALDTLVESAKNSFGGSLKGSLIKAAVRRVRALGGLRESPKFYIIQMMGFMRKSLLRCGEDLVQKGILTKDDDLFFLYLDELEALARGELDDVKSLVAKHRDNFERELLRNQIPRLLVSDGRTYYEGMMAKDLDEGSIIGSPVSPGVIEGTVRVVFDPHDANLLPGEILVCPGTDPAWTPLFLAASGLVMEIGGMMTHGAIVAREYGIPAVVGVNRATQVLESGVQIRINGSTGLIEILN